ncbi:MAG: polysaccharide deacetylase family protein [Waddliaceae bacterium]|jgi:peptidoglycan/xylan/chitin deacetylase (PgdA/CDA1 family)|nr:polysaccharide deacetylase family protein [Waddliaceae bacterium]MBT3579624.1 polysaccharide deacetylase family protein [Waddliaceae bacterium]MBT4444610.1 polysaccharide deacetylase family protein [Waddliaceae bacterium]MBT6928131.1 polysaccharide deacetylase family protein [Waddliaceae bacterium]MBT7264693.1 polysaccharide deacetylase family protein [Waddliaceae bacterium]
MFSILLYHRVGTSRISNNYNLLRDHFSYIADNYAIILPGEPIPRKTPALCISFDDASFDFYQYIFPLLQKLNLRALLAVPVKYIVEKSYVDTATRLSIPHYEAMNDGIYDSKAPYCSWEEIEEMVASQHVAIASHSYSHANITLPGVDLDKEVIFSKELLEQRLKCPVTSFVYPFGKTSRDIHAFVSKHYAYGMKISGAANRSWENNNGLLYRRCCDSLTHHLQPFSKANRFGATAKYFINTMR